MYQFRLAQNLTRHFSSSGSHRALRALPPTGQRIIIIFFFPDKDCVCNLTIHALSMKKQTSIRQSVQAHSHSGAEISQK